MGIILCKECKQNQIIVRRTICRKCNAKRVKEWRIKNDYVHKRYVYLKWFEPWKITYQRIQRRIKYQKRYLNIKCLLTIDDLRFLWFRDKAYFMKKPSIDRINSQDNYSLKNCQYIELKDNQKQGIENKWKKYRRPILQLNIQGNFIKKWDTQMEAARNLGISAGNIWNCLKKRYTQTGGFKWKYAIAPKL